jgi:hypothetical protein
MLSSLVLNRRGFMRLTCCAFTSIRVGKNKFPLVQRLATNVSPGGLASVIGGAASNVLPDKPQRSKR